MTATLAGAWRGPTLAQWLERFNRDNAATGGFDLIEARLEERMAGTQTQERTQTQGTGQSQKVNAIGAFPESGYAGTVDGSPVAVISTGNVEGMSPAHLVVDEQGLSRWVPISAVKFTDASLQDTISRSRSSR